MNPKKPSLIYWIVSYLFVFPLFRLFFRGKINGIENVPVSGPLVVVANHGSYLDPPLLGHCLRRPVAFMAKAELFQLPILGLVIRACGAYPVNRGASDRTAIKNATNMLLQGWATGVFLDGTRQSNGKVNNPLPGAALLAARSGAQLLPVAVINSHRALGINSWRPRFIPIHLRIGKPLPPPESRRKIDLETTTIDMQKKINSLLEKGLIITSKKSL